MHDVRQLPGQVPVVGLHLVMILLLVLFDQSLVHCQRLTAGVHKLPEEGEKISREATSAEQKVNRRPQMVADEEAGTGL